jgi:hypothetical protein
MRDRGACLTTRRAAGPLSPLSALVVRSGESDRSRTSLADALGLLSRWRLLKPQRPEVRVVYSHSIARARQMSHACCTHSTNSHPLRPRARGRGEGACLSSPLSSLLSYVVPSPLLSLLCGPLSPPTLPRTVSALTTLSGASVHVSYE